MQAVAANPDPGFWPGRRVLVTGHTGFKGSWLVTWLRLLGADVSGYALDPPSDPSLYAAAGLEQLVPRLGGDVRDADELAAAVEHADPEVVFHLAAQSLVRASYDDPLVTLATNTLGTATLLDAVRRHPSAGAVVCITSDKCYENREWVWAYREDDELGGHDPYSASKACAEIVVAAFRRSYLGTGAADVPVATARAGNVIGGGDWSADRLLPDIVRAAAAATVPEIRSPAATRPWQHVLEPLSGYLLLAERLWQRGHEAAQAWNLGPAEDDAMPVSWVVDRVLELWGAPPGWCPQAGEHPHEATFLRLDASKARAHLGWRPRLSVGDALAWVVDWHRRFEHGEDARTLLEEQIARYVALAPAGA